MSYCLAAPGRIAEDFIAGSLNTYAGVPQAYDDEAQEIGLILAGHASAGMRAVSQAKLPPAEVAVRNGANDLKGPDPRR